MTYCAIRNVILDVEVMRNVFLRAMSTPISVHLLSLIVTGAVGKIAMHQRLRTALNNVWLKQVGINAVLLLSSFPNWRHGSGAILHMWMQSLAGKDALQIFEIGWRKMSFFLPDFSNLLTPKSHAGSHAGGQGSLIKSVLTAG